MKAQKEAFVAIYDEYEKLVAIVHKCPESRHQVIFKVEEMDDEEIADLINNKNGDAPLKTTKE